jgi:hypothetical protein
MTAFIDALPFSLWGGANSERFCVSTRRSTESPLSTRSGELRARQRLASCAHIETPSREDLERGSGLGNLEGELAKPCVAPDGGKMAHQPRADTLGGIVVENSRRASASLVAAKYPGIVKATPDGVNKANFLLCSTEKPARRLFLLLGRAACRRAQQHWEGPDR